jgi:hypothetical protein
MFEEMAPATLVVALMGTDKPGPGATQMFEDARYKYNKNGPFLDVRYLHAEDLAQQVRADLAPAPLNLEVEMERWHKHDGLHESFQGIVRVEDIASWYQDHGSQLFHLNIRNPLGATRTNARRYCSHRRASGTSTTASHCCATQSRPATDLSLPRRAAGSP